MHHIATLVLACAFAALAAWGTYWFIVRPYLVAKCIYIINGVRISLLDAKLDNLDGCQTRVYAELLDSTSETESVEVISFSMIVWRLVRNRAVVQAESVAFRERLEKSPDWLRELHNRRHDASIAVFILNSPSWWIPMAVFLTLSLISQRWRNYRSMIDGPNGLGMISSTC